MSHSHIFLKPAFLRTPSQNGVGRYVCQLQRVVLKFCKNNGSSRGMRDFIESELINFSKDNPGIVVYLKPRRHRTASLTAEFLNGDKQYLSCRNFTKEEIIKWLHLFRGQQQNRDGTRLRKLSHTEHPSIQGPWTPYTFRDPALNLVEFPNTTLSQPLNMPKSATEELVELFQKQKIEDLEEKSKE